MRLLKPLIFISLFSFHSAAHAISISHTPTMCWANATDDVLGICVSNVNSGGPATSYETICKLWKDPVSPGSWLLIKEDNLTGLYATNGSEREDLSNPYSAAEAWCVTNNGLFYDENDDAYGGQTPVPSFDCIYLELQ